MGRVTHSGGPAPLRYARARLVDQAEDCGNRTGDRREVIDRVAVRWIERAPPLVGTMMFRVGPIDERLKTSGITHLAEHLALHPLRSREHAFNGAVHVDYTVFWAAGSAEQVVQFFRDLCRSLTDLPTDRLEAEARVLAAESQALTGSHYTDLLRTWYGPNGPGLLGAPEFGLDWIGPAHVGAWANTHFTAANAVLTLTGPPPKRLRLNLPVGDYVPVTMPPDDAGFRPNRQVKLRSQPAGICLGTVARTICAPGDGNRHGRPAPSGAPPP